MTVWKFVLGVSYVQDIEMPAGAELLCLGRQNDEICVWARIDPEAPRVLRRLQTVGPGYAGVSGIYVGTFMIEGDVLLVFHVFDHGEVWRWSTSTASAQLRPAPCGSGGGA